MGFCPSYSLFVLSILVDHSVQLGSSWSHCRTMGTHVHAPWHALSQSRGAVCLSFPAGPPSGGAVAADLDEVASVDHSGVRRGARRSRVGHVSWSHKVSSTVSFD